MRELSIVSGLSLLLASRAGGGSLAASRRRENTRLHDEPRSREPCRPSNDRHFATGSPRRTSPLSSTASSRWRTSSPSPCDWVSSLPEEPGAGSRRRSPSTRGSSCRRPSPIDPHVLVTAERIDHGRRSGPPGVSASRPLASRRSGAGGPGGQSLPRGDVGDHGAPARVSASLCSGSWGHPRRRGTASGRDRRRAATAVAGRARRRLLRARSAPCPEQVAEGSSSKRFGVRRSEPTDVQEPPARGDVGHRDAAGPGGDEVIACVFQSEPAQVRRRGGVQGPTESLLQAADARRDRRREIRQPSTVEPGRSGAADGVRDRSRPGGNRSGRRAPPSGCATVRAAARGGTPVRGCGRRVGVRGRWSLDGVLVDEPESLRHRAAAVGGEVELGVELDRCSDRGVQQELELGLQVAAGDQDSDLREPVAAVELHRSARHEHAGRLLRRPEPAPTIRAHGRLRPHGMSRW